MLITKTKTMKKKLNFGFAAFLIGLLTIVSQAVKGQTEEAVIEKLFKRLPAVPVSTSLQEYRMTAVYTNRDLYGNFTEKTKVTGDYTRGIKNGLVKWNNVYISGSNNFSEPFTKGIKQEYMENKTYIPSPKMLENESFKEFPAGVETVLAKNLIWDMMAIEGFAWDYKDSLKLNRIYRIPEIKGAFNMADIGTYSHTEIQVCWTGISAIDGELCALIEFRAVDNMIELSLDALKTKGTEQYWGTIWVSLNDMLIEKAVMYGGTIQEIAVTGLDNKFLIKTIRELWVDKIQ
jgi:hypothetical protein